MKHNIIIFLVLLSGTYTTVLCVRNQEDSHTLASSSHGSDPPSGERAETEGRELQVPKDPAEVQRLESGVPGGGLKGPVGPTQDLSDQVPDTESETKVVRGHDGPDVSLPKVEGDLKGPGNSDPGSGDLSLGPKPGLGAGVGTEDLTRRTGELGESGSSSSKTTREELPVPPEHPVQTRDENQNRGPEGAQNQRLSQGQDLRSTTTGHTINQLPAQPPQTPVVRRPEVPSPPVTPPLESRTKEVDINPVVNPGPNPTTDRGQPSTQGAPQPNPQGTPAASTGANATQGNVEATKDNQVKEVLMSSLKEMQANFDNVNSTELAQPPADKVEAAKKSLCESFKTDLVNVCTASGQNSSADLLALVNNYYRNNVCTTEHSLNQLFNKDGDFAYKLLAGHLAQFSKKAPNKSTQDVYDKSVPVVKKLAELMKNAELALVSEKVKGLLEKRNLVLTSALCAVANADPNVMASTQVEAGQVVLTLNQEDYIKETTEAFMKAYAPMADLLKEFDVMMPKLLEIFEAGFENKINMLTSLANSRKASTQPGVNAPGLAASGSAPGSSGAAASGAGSGTGPLPPATSRAPTGPLSTSQVTNPLQRQPATSSLNTETTRPLTTGVALNTRTTVGTGLTPGRPTMLQLLGDDDREVAAVHGHPSLIQKYKSLLQVNAGPETALSPDPTLRTSTSPGEVTPGGLTGQLSGRSGPGTGAPGEAGSQGVRGPQVGGNRPNGMEVLDRTTAGGVRPTDNSQHQLATSGSGPALPKLGAGAMSRAGAEAEVTGTGPLGVIGQIKNRLMSLVSRGGSEPQAPGRPSAPSEEALKRQRDIENEHQLFDEAMKQFVFLGIFKTVEGKFVAELDEQKVKALVRANLLTLNDFDSVYNLVVGPQRSLHSLYMFMEHMLLSPDADEKIKNLEDSNLLERIKKMVNPLEDLYEQIKANLPRLTLRRPTLGPESELEAPVRPSGEAPAEHVNRRGRFVLVSNSSGVNLSEHNLLLKLNKILQNLSARSGFKVSER
ncbi:hypothetical protein MACJ_002144 [Theileria orientalis]|uniref:Uncharacterized protein n=1 Tax=Theileria orientalis TaxID=68886 RepID=A0A976M5M6_THEOR|nr:hypothetical protein MACJ_002144 [Theileria orientalis]